MIPRNPHPSGAPLSAEGALRALGLRSTMPRRVTSDKRKMGEFVNPRWVPVVAWTMALAIIAVNAELLWLILRDLL